MRDSVKPYSGDPRVNKLLPLPRPTYTEFINRARSARMLDRLDFLFCSPEAVRPPRIDATPCAPAGSRIRGASHTPPPPPFE